MSQFKTRGSQHLVTMGGNGIGSLECGIGDRVSLRPVSGNDKEIIVLVELVDEQACQGEVVGFPGRSRTPQMGYSIGQKVKFSKDEVWFVEKPAPSAESNPVGSA